ncbi:MAG: helicase-related protein [Phycisphaerales bacterium JB050]
MAIHGNKSQNARTRAMQSFRSGRTTVLVATDIASRGIDVDEITHVFNYDMPADAETYVHRIGRTARAGASGIAISLCDRDETGLLRAIMRRTEAKIEFGADFEDLTYASSIEAKPDRPARKNFRPKYPKRGQGQNRPKRNGAPKREGRVGGRSAGKPGGRPGGRPSGKPGAGAGKAGKPKRSNAQAN